MRFFIPWALLLCLVSPAGAADLSFYAAATGSGLATNDCLTAATPCELQRAVDQQPIGTKAQIYLADGTYWTAGANVMYHKITNFIGNCANPQNVYVIVGAAQVAFLFQDGVFGGVSCLRMAATGNGSTGVRSRQIAILDIANVEFGNFPAGVHIAAVENARVNCLNGIVVSGNAQSHAQADGHSSLSMGCSYTLAANVSMTWVVLTNRSIAKFTGASWVGGSNSGLRYAVDNSTLELNGYLPPGVGTYVAGHGEHVQ